MRNPLSNPRKRFNRRKSWIIGTLIVAVTLSWLAGCSSLGYYGQAIWGHSRILWAGQSIADLLADPATPEPLRSRLRFLTDVRTFAIDQLHLPDNGFRTYAELPPDERGQRRRAVVWNVVAAPELSTEPVVWCFPIAGCVAYRGYFSEQRARRFAAGLATEGYDVDVGGVAAYSTLGWFEDPVLSTVIEYPDVDLAGLVFHELAHQVVYVEDDTRFNESFATAVEVAGLRRWLASREQEQDDRLTQRLEEMHREAEVSELILEFRQRLTSLYGENDGDDVKRGHKAELFEELRGAYAELKATWGVDTFSWDGWFERPLNNARLSWIGAYHELVPAFLALLEDNGDDLNAFYAAVQKLAELAPEERQRHLKAQI
jgi:predicted aminopeptidase